MGKKSNVSFSMHAKIYEELNAIESFLKRPITQKECFHLFHRLENTSSALHEIKNEIGKISPLSIQEGYLEEIEEKIRSLFGKVIERKVDYQVDQIKKETEELEKKLKEEKKSSLVHQSSSLQEHVTKLLHDHCLSKEQLPTIQNAKAALKEAQSFLKNESSHDHKKIRKKDLFLSFQKEEVLIDLINDLFEMAVSILKNEKSKAKIMFNMMTEQTKLQLDHHLRVLNTSLFEDPISSTQACIATAYELIGVEDLYFSQEEIISFYEDIIVIENEENRFRGVHALFG